MSQKLRLFKGDLLMLIETQYHPSVTFSIFQESDGTQVAHKGRFWNVKAAYRIRVRGKKRVPLAA